MIKFLIDDTINDTHNIIGIIKIRKTGWNCIVFRLHWPRYPLQPFRPKVGSNALLCAEHFMTFMRNTIQIQMTDWVWPKSPGNGKCSLVETDSAVTAGSWWHRMRQCSTSMWYSSLARASSSLYLSEPSRRHTLYSAWPISMMWQIIYLFFVVLAVHTLAVVWLLWFQSFRECCFSLSLARCSRLVSRTRVLFPGRLTTKPLTSRNKFVSLITFYFWININESLN